MGDYSKRYVKRLALAVVPAFLGIFTVSAIGQGVAESQTSSTTTRSVVSYKTVKVGDLDIFYREAGDPRRPTILLLHGFPTSSFMFRNLIPRLAANFHVIAPDYPGRDAAVCAYFRYRLATRRRTALDSG